ncbi:MAG TPA: DMT family transporter [Candidatus Sulfotelmatobacter sp.]|nr:DMT family transporter [Candidatus Sulfotelmatobacter sp.]
MEHQEHHRFRHILSVTSLALAGSLWGTGFLFGKIALTEMTVSENVAFRFVAGAVALLPFVVRRWTPYRKSEWGMLLIASFIGTPVQFLIQFRGLQLTTVSHASLIVGALPVLLAATSAWFLRERLRRLEWGVLALSALGAVLIAVSGFQNTSGPRPSWQGDALIFVSLLAAVVMILYSKKLIKNHDSLQVTVSTIMIGTVMLLGWVELRHPVRFRFSAGVWGAAAAQGLLATAGAYIFWNWGLAHMPASRAGVFLNLEPLIGTLLGVLILHERLGVTAVLGGLLIVGAAVYFSIRPHQT